MMNAFIWLCSALAVPIVQSSGNLFAADEQPPIQYFEDDLNSTYGDVIFTSILFRHGDRNEVYTFETDQHHERFEKGDEDMGQLVRRGRQRAHRLGMWTRARYANLLQGRKYSPRLIKTVSSKVERTIQSAHLFLTGLFPPIEEEKWNDTIPLIPVPVYPIPLEEDNMIALVAHCPRYNMEVYQLKESEETKKFYKTYDEAFIDEMENNTGLKIPRDDAVQAIIVLYGVYDTLFVQKSLELTLPSWATPNNLNRLAEIEKMYFQILTFSDEMKRLKASPLLKSIFDSMLKKRNKEPSHRIFKVYSGHDNTLVVLLNTLKIYDGVPPPYSAAVFIELRLKDEQYYVTVLYRTSDTERPRLLELPNCKNPCDLDQFITSTHPVMTFMWEHDCNTFDPDYNRMLF